MFSKLSRHWRWMVIGFLLTGVAHGDGLSGSALIDALRQGGYVIVMRHASSPPGKPSPSAADVDNVNLERQLDEAGRKSAQAMGAAIHELEIPIGKILSSPTYRARATVRFADLGVPEPVAELGDGGQSMQPVKTASSVSLRALAAEPPATGTNTVIVTHAPNITAAFPELSVGIADGEALVFRTDGKGDVTLVARVKIEDWPTLATS